MPVEIRDYRSKQLVGGPKIPPGGKPYGKLDRSKRLILRNPKDITGITLHQMDAYLSPGNLPDRHLRAMNVHAHASVFKDGVGVLACPFRAFVYHGNEANDTCIGVEVEGTLPGTCGDFFQVPQIQVEAARETIKLIVSEAKKEGIEVSTINAHRQWHGSRRADPGEELWRKVVVEWAVPILGLRCDYAFFDKRLGKRDTKDGKPWPGKPIPKAWDPNGVGDY